MKKAKWLFLCPVPLVVYNVFMLLFYLLIDRVAVFLLSVGRPGSFIVRTGDWLYTNTYSVTIVIGFVIIFSVTMFCYHCLNRRAPFFPRFRFTSATLLVLVTLALLAQYTVSLLLNIILPLVPQLMQNYSEVMDSLGVTAPSVLDLLYGILLAPLMEEALLRGVTLSAAKRAVPFWAANLIQALLFGILHMNLVQGCYATFLGLILGYLVQRYHTLTPAFLVHICINLAGFLLVPGSAWMLLLCLGVSGIALFAALRHQKTHDPGQYLFTRSAPW